MTDPTKKGLYTTELGVTVGGVLATLLVTFGVINADQAQSVADLTAKAITGLMAIIAIYTLISKYVEGRNSLKQSMIEKGMVPPAPVAVEAPAPAA